MKVQSGIYKIQSKAKPSRIYIGSAVDTNKRTYEHLRTLKRGIHKNRKLQCHFNKYGEFDLQFSLLKNCDKNDLIKHEQFFIDTFNPWFNICPSAKNSLGVIRSPEFKRKASNSHKGLTPWNKGKKLGCHTLEHIKKISDSLIGNKRAEGKKGRLGIPHTELDKIKMRKPRSLIGRINISKALMGIHPTSKTRKRMSDSAKNVWIIRKLKITEMSQPTK